VSTAPPVLPALLRYAVVGVVATAVHYALLIGSVEGLRWPAWLGSGFGAVVGAQVAYAGNRWFTFAHRGSLMQSWPRFQVTALAGAGLGMAIVALAVRLGIHYVAGQVIATGAAMALTYAINRHWTFAATPGRG
jgi:putative flippase GtrA